MNLTDVPGDYQEVNIISRMCKLMQMKTAAPDGKSLNKNTGVNVSNDAVTDLGTVQISQLT